jgi:hypothetical protein
MRHLRFTWRGRKENFLSLITNSPAFQFDMSQIARIREEMTTLVDNLSKVYLPWLKEQELAERKAKRSARLNDSSQVVFGGDANEVSTVMNAEGNLPMDSIVEEANESNEIINDDGDATEEVEEDKVDEQWELTKIYTVKELKKTKHIMCSTEDCILVACSRWESTEGGMPWNSCLDCQEA